MLMLPWTSGRSTKQARLRQAAQVAHACQGQVFNRVRLRLAEMVLPEARGYIRARAGRIVAGEVRRQTAKSPFTPAELHEISELAMQALTSAVLGQHVRDQRHAGQRRAA